jgi:3D (Asp-Asp-Asp) domain-containing protein
MKNKTKIILSVLGLLLASFIILPQISYSFTKTETKTLSEDKKAPKVLSVDVWLTAYSSSPDETDDTPFITASGERVRDGIVATNFLPMNSTSQIPEIFGDKVFIVKDRMHHRKTNFVDIWMSSKEEALEFGIYETQIIVIDTPSTELTLLQ